MKNLWMWVGITFEITEEEEKILFSNDRVAGAEIIKKVFTAGRCNLDGNTYIPYNAVVNFNEEYDTDHDAEGDYEWDL